jgi:hypothetical protein
MRRYTDIWVLSVASLATCFACNADSGEKRSGSHEADKAGHSMQDAGRASSLEPGGDSEPVDGGSAAETDDDSPQPAGDASARAPNEPEDGNGESMLMDTGSESPEPVAEPDPNRSPQAELFMCAGEPASSPARMRRIERREWVRATGSSETGYKSSEVARTNPFDAPPAAPYSTWSEGVSIDPTTLDLYFGVLGDTVSPWLGRDVTRTPRTYDDPELRCMFEDSAPDSACIDYYLTSLLEDGVLYRTPNEGERQRLRSYTDSLLARESNGETTREDTLRRVASAAWLQSGALFRREMGEGSPDGQGRRRLSDWELAQALALMISDRPPGAMGTYRFGEGPDGGSWTPADPMAGYLADIETAARDGSIQDPQVIGNLIRVYGGGVDEERLDLNVDFGVEERAARGEFWVSQKIQRFFREWLGYEGVELIFKDTPYATSQFATDPYTDDDRSSINSSWSNLLSGYYGQESLLSQQLDDVIARVVVEDTDVLRTLLTTRLFFVASTTERGSADKSTRNTHRPYNLTDDVGATRAERWVEMPQGERAGVLTHPAFLAAHAGNFEDDANAVHRGRVIREQLLCESVPGLELVMVEAKLVPSDPAKSARDRLAESVEGRPECEACHTLMNPLGYAFETYNHAGFLRSDDHGMQPDGSTVLEGMPDPALDGPIADAIELSTKLADSNHVKRCFIRHSFRFFMGRNETPRDSCALSAMENAYDDSGGSFFAMLEALATHDTFLYRHDEVDPDEADTAEVNP